MDRVKAIVTAAIPLMVLPIPVILAYGLQPGSRFHVFTLPLAVQQLPLGSDWRRAPQTHGAPSDWGLECDRDADCLAEQLFRCLRGHRSCPLTALVRQDHPPG